MQPRTWTRWLARLFGQQIRTERKPRRRPVLETLEDRLAPATINWLGTTSGNWNTATNCSASGVKRATLPCDDLVFGPTPANATHATTNDIPTTSGVPTYNSITISAGGYSLAGPSSLGLSGSFIVNASVGTAAVSLNMRL